MVAESGGPEVLTFGEFPDPVVKRNMLMVSVKVAGVNYIDVYQRDGRYEHDRPFIPGREGAGFVISVGHEVTGFSPGDRVAWASGVPGSYSTIAAIPADRAVHVPPPLNLETAAAAMIQGMTAHYLTRSTYDVTSSDTVLVHAGAGGTGNLVVQMAKRSGGTVIATVSTPQKAELAKRAGADAVVSYEDAASSARSLTAGEGVSVVYDGVGRATFDESLASLRTRGLLVLYGGASGPVPAVDPLRLMRAGAVFLTRPTLIPAYVRTREEFLWRSGEVFRAIMSGALTLRIGGRYALAEARQAHADLQSRATVGKLLLFPA
jgi:NADPH2:quinone reductase